MILRIILKNFLSFSDEVQFDMFPNLKRTTLSSHIHHAHDSVPLLRLAAIYGANGAGKSNLIKAFNFLKRVATQKDFLNEEAVLRCLYALQEDYEEQVMELAVEFITKSNNPYIYSIKVSRKGIEAETLWKSGLGRQENKVVFNRDGSKVSFAQSPVKAILSIIENWLEKNPYSSLLSLVDDDFSVLNNKVMEEAWSWFENELVVVTTDASVPQLISIFRHSEQINTFASKLFGNVGLGIDQVKVKTENFDEWLQRHPSASIPSADKIDEESVIMQMSGTTNVFELMKEEGERKVSQFMFEQLGRGGFRKGMDISAQSLGTQRLLVLVPALYDAVVSGKTVLVDEIEHSIHPHLVRELVRFFSTEKVTGQLIFTTHETCLLNQEIIRADEVWFVEKKEGVSYAYSLNDFKPHHTIDIEKGYLEGRYGAVPFIGELHV